MYGYNRYLLSKSSIESLEKVVPIYTLRSLKIRLHFIQPNLFGLRLAKHSIYVGLMAIAVDIVATTFRTSEVWLVGFGTIGIFRIG